jgi:hypothetical protein
MNATQKLGKKKEKKEPKQEATKVAPSALEGPIKKEEPKKPPTRIMLCLPGSSFTHNFLKSLITTISWCIGSNISISVRNNTGANIYAVREDILECVYDTKTKEIALFNGEDYDYILWIDSDMKWKPNDIKTLIDADKDIISGACLKTNGEFAAAYLYEDKTNRLILSPKLEGEHFMPEIFENKSIPGSDLAKMTEPVEVSTVGFAFILIKKGVFEKFGPPWFMQVTHKTPNYGNTSYFSEDFSFCVRARAAGFKIWFHPKAVIGHEKSMVLMP